MNFNFCFMRHFYSFLQYIVMIAAMIVFYACTDEIIESSYESSVGTEMVDDNDLLFTIGLSDAVHTKLTYEETAGTKGLMTKWTEGDQVALNANPGNTKYQYDLFLKSGAGTSNGEFLLSGTHNVQACTWAFYYPGDRIKCDEDFYKMSYKGQVQHGNANTGHLEAYHAVRYVVTNKYPINVNDMTDVNFTGDEVVQSGCMKFNLSGLPSIVPVNITLEYYNPEGNLQKIFSTYNYYSYYGEYAPVWEVDSKIELALTGFEKTATVTAYVMMSNHDVDVKKDGKFRVTVTDDKGGKYYCDKTIKADATLSGGELNMITCTEWETISDYDGFVDTDNGITILQEKTKGKGLDIIIMGDGYAEENFGAGSAYDIDMRQAYSDFFSIEPYKSLKEYFNVYYINAVSEDNHDAHPTGLNGAQQGNAETVFATSFTPNSTTISGNNEAAVNYAMQAIRMKGGNGGTPCEDEDEVYRRAHTALIMVMINVKCHAGSCYVWFSMTEDYGNAYSVAYTSLGTSEHARRFTTLHEAAGHGFGKLCDEYSTQTFAAFDSAIWDMHEHERNCGVSRNVDKYWKSAYSSSVSMSWSGVLKEDTVEETTSSNVSWSSLVPYYSATEGLGVYEGGNLCSNMYCRSTENSLMRSQFEENGQFFNAISRWAIWYRVMRLAGVNVGNTFQASFDAFMSFDSGLEIQQNIPSPQKTKSVDIFEPTASPVLKFGHWVNGRFIEE